MLAIEDSATGRFLDRLGEQLPRPRAVLVASAHYLRAETTVTATPHPETIHDFGGFPAPLYEIQYPATGAPALADEVTERLRHAGIVARAETDAGIDHGVWVPLRRMYPQADIPVVALSINPHGTAEEHHRVGLVLSELRNEGVLIVGSGGFSHNLRALEWRSPDAPVFPWVDGFIRALRARLEAGDTAGVLDWAALPDALRNHPTQEHLYPLHVAFGAGGPHAKGRLLHQDVEMGGLALDAFAFG